MKATSSIFFFLCGVMLAGCGSSGSKPASPPENGPPATSGPAGRNSIPPSLSAGDKLPGYTPLTEAFSNPEAILTTSDTEGALRKLRRIASPTTRYEQDLLDLVSDAQTLDVAHLQLLLRALYFPYDDYVDVRRALQDQRTAADEALRLKLERNRDLALGLAPFVSRLLNDAIPKLDRIDFDGALYLLRQLYPRFGAQTAFDTVLDRLSPLTAPQKLELMRLANEKAEPAPAERLAKDWFAKDSARSIGELLQLATFLDDGVKDDVLLAGVPRLVSCDARGADALARAASKKDGEVAAAAYARTGHYSQAEVVAIARDLSARGRGIFLVSALRQCPALNPADLVPLVELAPPASREKVVLTSAPRLSSLDIPTTVGVALRLSAGERDTWLSAALGKIPHVTTAELGNLVTAAEADDDLARAALPKVSDLTVANAVRISDWLDDSARDQFLYDVVDRVTDLTLESLETLVSKASEDNAEGIRKKGQARVNRALASAPGPTQIPPMPQP